MGLLDTLLGSQNDPAITKLASTLGLGENQARDAIAKLLPSLTAGMKKNMATPRGLESLKHAVASGKHQQYLDNPVTLRRQDTVNDGNAILGHLLGSKDSSRKVASDVAEQTGLDAGIMKKMLPLVAAMAMGGLSKQARSTDQASNTDNADDAGLLSSLLDADGDGSVIDDLAGLARKFF